MPVSQLMEAPPASEGALCRGQRAALADSGRDPLARLADVEGRSGVRWQNWARSQECQPERVFYPRTLDDVRAIVCAAAASGRRVGVAGRGHTMGPLSLTDDYLVDSKHLSRIGPLDVPNRLVTVESGVSVAELDRVLRQHGLAMPTNVVLTSVRYGGIVATGCHGAGWESQTISDLVEAMTIVTHTGEVVRFSEATHGRDVMNAVRCNLGTLGVIHDITLRVEPDFRLVAVDEHLPLSLTDDLGQLRSFLSGNDYVEVFWLPQASGLWAKSWNRTDAPARRRSWASTPGDFAKTTIGNALWKAAKNAPASTRVFNETLYRGLVPRHHSVVCDAADSLHYQKFIENVRCEIMSFAIVIDPEFRNVAKAWQVVVNKVREHAAAGESPLNLVLEMRVIRDSNVWLSPAFSTNGEHHCYFELISVAGTPKCREFFDEVAAAWMRSPELEARPHWAKYFADIPGIVPYIHQAWRGNLAKFARLRDQIDPERMFCNPAMQRILYPAADAH
jgi:FAD/FMN-containing dehydrogenase